MGQRRGVSAERWPLFPDTRTPGVPAWGLTFLVHCPRLSQGDLSGNAPLLPVFQRHFVSLRIKPELPVAAHKARPSPTLTSAGPLCLISFCSAFGSQRRSSPQESLRGCLRCALDTLRLSWRSFHHLNTCVGLGSILLKFVSTPDLRTRPYLITGSVQTS